MIESIIIQNPVTNTTLYMDKLTTNDFVLDTADLGSVDGISQNYKYLNQDGSYTSGTTLNSRSPSITGWILASTEQEMTLRKNFLNRLINPKQEVNIIYKNYTLKCLPSRSITYGLTESENNDSFCKFSIVGVCSNPVFSSLVEEKVVAAGNIGLFHFPLIMSPEPNPPGGVVFGYKTPSLIFTVNNTGTISSGIKIHFKATGEVLNPSLININTQEYIKINKTLQASEEVIIDTNIGQKKITGIIDDEEINYFRYKDFNSTWLQIEVGDNVFRYDADSNIENLELIVYHDNKYLEVQECY